MGALRALVRRAAVGLSSDWPGNWLGVAHVATYLAVAR